MRNAILHAFLRKVQLYLLFKQSYMDKESQRDVKCLSPDVDISAQNLFTGVKSNDSKDIIQNAIRNVIQNSNEFKQISSFILSLLENFAFEFKGDKIELNFRQKQGKEMKIAIPNIHALTDASTSAEAANRYAFIFSLSKFSISTISGEVCSEIVSPFSFSVEAILEHSDSDAGKNDTAINDSDKQQEDNCISPKDKPLAKCEVEEAINQNNSKFKLVIIQTDIVVKCCDIDFLLELKSCVEKIIKTLSQQATLVRKLLKENMIYSNKLFEQKKALCLTSQTKEKLNRQDKDQSLKFDLCFLDKSRKIVKEHKINLEKLSYVFLKKREGNDIIALFSDIIIYHLLYNLFIFYLLIVICE